MVASGPLARIISCTSHSQGRVGLVVVQDGRLRVTARVTSRTSHSQGRVGLVVVQDGRPTNMLHPTTARLWSLTGCVGG